MTNEGKNKELGTFDAKDALAPYAESYRFIPPVSEGLRSFDVRLVWRGDGWAVTYAGQILDRQGGWHLDRVRTDGTGPEGTRWRSQREAALALMDGAQAILDNPRHMMSRLSPGEKLLVDQSFAIIRERIKDQDEGRMP